MPPARGVKKPKDDKSDHRVLANRYLVERKLGGGNYGTAYLVHDTKANTGKGEEEWKVLKEISCSDLAPDETVDAMHESKLLSKLHHPNIVRFNDSFLDGEFFCIITEFCEGGDLDDRITACKKSGRTFDQNLIMDWFVQLALAVQYMHSRKVLHRDLKTRNIFLKNNMIKIGDFGISRVLMGTTDMASTFTGTPYYMSPEVLKHEGYNSKSDIWSIACILYELCSLQHAFEGQSLMGVMYKIVEGKTPEIPKKYDKNIQELLNVMLNRDPAKRPSATEVTKLPFVSRHIEKMKKRIAELKEHREDTREYIEQDTQELTTLLREKTHFEDLKDVSLRESAPQQAPPQHQQHRMQGPTVGDPYKDLTPRERMRIRKIQLADEKGQIFSVHARNNLVQNIQRKEVLKGSIGTFNRPAWQGGRGEQHQPMYYDEPPQGFVGEGSFRGRLSGTAPDIYQEDDGGMGNSGSNWEREDMGTVREASYEDRPIKPAVSPSAYTKEGQYQSYDDRPIKSAMSPDLYGEDGMGTLKAPSSGDDRPITPLKKGLDLDDPNISLATPPGLKPLQAKKQPVKKPQTKPAAAKSAKATRPAPLKTSQQVGRPVKSPTSPTKKTAAPNSPTNAKPKEKSPESPTKVLARVAEAIPADADAADTFYSQNEDFESGSDSGDDGGSDMDNDDYDALMECMQSALDTDSGDQNETLKDNTLSAFSPAMRDTKIKNLRAECERKIGKESFESAYSFLKSARFGDRNSAGDTTMDEGEIMKGLKKFVKNASDCFLIDQLLFLEEQASFDR